MQPETCRQLFLRLPDALVIVDSARTIAVVNDAAAELFGGRRDDFEGRSLELLIPEAYRSAHRDHVARFASHPEARPPGSGLDLHARRLDGTTFPAQIGLIPLEDSGMGPLVACLVRDRSRESGFVEELRRGKQALELRLERLAAAASRVLETEGSCHAGLDALRGAVEG